MSNIDQGQGFGGGAPDEQPTQGAIPDSAPADPQWGQSLGQDVGNVGSAIGNAASSVGNAVGNVAGTVGDYLGSRPGVESIKQWAPRIASYISHQGAGSQEQFDAYANRVNPSQDEDMNTVVPKVISTAFHEDPEAGSAMLKYAGTRYDLHRLAAAKAMNEAQPNDELAAQELNTAFNYLPNGDKITVAPGQGGNFVAKVTTADNQHSEFNLSRDAMQAFTRTTKGLFDTNIHSPDIFKNLASAGGEQQRAAAGPGLGGMQPQTEHTDEGVAPDPNARPGSGNVVGNIPHDTLRQEFGPGTANGPSGQGTEAGGDRGPTPTDAGVHRNGVTRLPTPGEPDTDAVQSQSSEPEPKVHWNPETTRFEYNPEDVKTSPGGTRGPVRVISGGVKPEDAGDVPSATYHPGKAYATPTGSSKQQGTTYAQHYQPGTSTLGQTRNQRNAGRDVGMANVQARQDIADQNNQTRSDIAGRQIHSREGVASQNNQTRLQIAHDRAADLASNTSDRVAAEQARTASGILRDTMKSGNADLPTAIQKMRDAGIDNRLINSLVPPTQGGGRSQQQLNGGQAPQTQAPRNPQARVQGMIYVTPAMGPMKWTGTGWVKP